MDDKNHRPGPIDYNRGRPAPKSQADTTPQALRWAYWLFIAASIVMLCAGLVGIFGLGGAEVAEPGAVRFNRLLVAGTNVVAAVVFSVLAPQLPRGSKVARRVLTGVVVLALFMNIAAFLIGIAGLLLLIIPVMLAFCLLFMYRPEANEFVRSRSGGTQWHY